MEFDFDDPSLKAALALHEGQERQGPGSRATTELLLDLAAPLPERPRVLDLGSGTGAATLVLARIEGARVTAVDVYTPFLEQLRAAAESEGVADRVDVRHGSMADLDDLPDGSFDLIWSEGAAYNIGFGAALASWRRLLSPEGVLVVTECGWITDESTGCTASTDTSTATWGTCCGARRCSAGSVLRGEPGEPAGEEHLGLRATWPWPTPVLRPRVGVPAEGGRDRRGRPASLPPSRPTVLPLGVAFGLVVTARHPAHPRSPWITRVRPGRPGLHDRGRSLGRPAPTRRGRSIPSRVLPRNGSSGNGSVRKVVFRGEVSPSVLSATLVGT